jgi:hypothetical protein
MVRPFTPRSVAAMVAKNVIRIGPAHQAMRAPLAATNSAYARISLVNFA